MIGTDGGLLGAPVAVTRLIMAPGERVKIVLQTNRDSGFRGGAADVARYFAAVPDELVLP